jgi:Ca2+-transporting ATPase
VGGLSRLQGASVLAILLSVFLIALQRGKGELEARSLAFATLIVANVALIFVNRSWRRSLLETLRAPNAALWWVSGAAAVFLALTLYVPVLRRVFRFAYLHVDDVLLCIAAGVLSIAWFEVLKLFQGRSLAGTQRG